MASEKARRVVFIGNIPYGVTEELIVDTLSRVGQVVHFRLVYDNQTGKPKGFGFAEFSDPDAAASAVRNLNDTELMGRKLRVDWSNDGGKDDSTPAGYNAQATNGQDGAHSTALPPLPPGTELPPNLTCPDAISRTLSTLPAPQLLDILSQMKGLVMSDPTKATELLRQAPQLSYAIFQSLLLLGLVDTNVLGSVVEQTSIPQPTPQPVPAPQAVPLAVPPPQQAFPYAPIPHHMNVPTPPVVAPAYQPPPQQQYQPPPQQQPPQIDRAALIQQVLAMPQSQIDALPPTERVQLMALRAQLMSAQGQAY